MLPRLTRVARLTQPPALSSPPRPMRCPSDPAQAQHPKGETVSTLALLVVLLLVLVAALLIGAVVYLTHRHPRLAQPLGVGGTCAAVVALVVTR